jgi:hypothetical protein
MNSLLIHYKEEIEELSVFQSREWKVGLNNMNKRLKS